MGRNGIAAEDVIMIAEQLVQKGDVPTIEKVRILLGTGSNSTIAKHLTQWKTLRLKGHYQEIASVYIAPDPVNQAVAKVWQQLQEENQTKLEALETDAAEKIQLAQAEKEQALNELHRMTQDNQDLRVLLKETREQNAELEKQRIALSQSLAVAESKLNLVEEARKKMDDYANTTLASIEEKHQQALAQYETHLSESKQFYTHELSQMKEIAENQRHEHIVEIDHLKTANQKLQAQLQEKDKTNVEIMSRVGQLNIQMQNQQGGIADILAGIQQNEKMSVKLKEELSQELTEIVKQEGDQQTQQVLLEFQRQLVSQKESNQSAKSKVK
ncbi:MAG: hypothetical protein HKM04_07240 [Legionellales bacterium]|nr:hypothetical protein [Legionellales bacterium]